MNDNTALFLFDFDKTLVDGHSHNYIGERLSRLIYLPSGRINFKSHEEYEQFTRKNSIALMKNFLADDNLNWKNKEKIQDLMKEILASDHKIGIVTFNDYPDAVKYAIEQLLGKEAADKIYIKSGLPASSYGEIQKCNKVLYIKEVMEKTGITNIKNVFFMDDDPKNVIAATDFGIQAVLVGKDGIEYINEVYNFWHKFNNGHDIFVEFNNPFIESKDIYILNGAGYDPVDCDIMGKIKA